MMNVKEEELGRWMESYVVSKQSCVVAEGGVLCRLVVVVVVVAGRQQVTTSSQPPLVGRGRSDHPGRRGLESSNGLPVCPGDYQQHSSVFSCLRWFMQNFLKVSLLNIHEFRKLQSSPVIVTKKKKVFLKVVHR